MKKPKISVLMSVYNSEKYLGQAIESILDQTYTDFEFIIIDDGSTDNMPKIIREYVKLDDRIRYGSYGNLPHKNANILVDQYAMRY